ncbi:hypothetical protein R5R35_011290 [Gryllus longicercus]|uniref:SEFIR domain-containing protein n=1 Tax=Gryllus longicercus TaxID=2509291 RepID=A0AAN9Z4C3_9ORTH
MFLHFVEKGMHFVMDATVGSSLFSPMFLLLLTLPSNPSATLPERCNVSRDVHLSDDICLISSYSNSTGLSDSVISPEDIDFILRDRTSGILEVKFPILKKYVAYELRLNVIEHVRNQEECNKYVDLQDYLLHSIRQFDVFSCKDDLEQKHCDSAPACTKYTSVIFSHVFGGCYLLHITPKNNSSSGQPTTRRRMIHSEHKKTVIWNMKPSVADQSYPDEIRLSVSNLTILYDAGSKVRFKLYLFDDCDEYGDIKQEWVLVLTDKNTQLRCETINDGFYHPYCELVSNRSDVHNSVACTFYNMTPGQYCVILEPIDRDRCHPGTVWTHGHDKISPCKYQHAFTVRKKNLQNQTPVPLSTNHNNNTLIVIGSVGALTALVILCLAMYSGLHYSFPAAGSGDATRNAEIPSSKNNTHPHVLLLYAQDCQPFMKLMSTLRSVLSRVGKCEVLDCFDPACAEFVAAAPEDWMLRAVSVCRIVLVINDCGAELQRKSSLVHAYRYPLPFCHLFLVGLKHVMGSLSSREYCRVFVVRFDSQDLNWITPHIRFLLPHNLSDLLRHLNPSCDTEILEECKDDQRLKDDIEEFLHFKKENPNYLKNLMMPEDNF